MGLEFRDFEKANPGVIKPSPLPFFVDSIPDNKFDTFGIAAFDMEFLENLTPDQKAKFTQGTRLEVLQRTDKEKAEVKKDRLIQETRVTDGVIGALRGFLPKDYLLSVAQFNNQPTYSKVEQKQLEKESETNRFTNALKNVDLRDKDNKVNEFAQRLYGDEFLDFIFNKRQQGSILPENLNLFEGPSRKVFSSADEVGSEIFGSYDHFKRMQDTSLSPRSILDKRYSGFTKNSSAVLDKIGQMKVQGESFKALQSEFVTSEDADLIVAGETNPLTGKKVVIKPNFYDMVMSGFVPRFSDEDVYNFVSMGYENITRFANVAREPYGNFKDIPILQEGEKIPDPKSTNLTPREKEILEAQDKLLKHTNEWWDGKMKSGMTESIYTIYSALGAFSQIALNAMDWGNWDAGGQNGKVGEFQSKIVNGFVSHMESQYLPKFRSTKVLSTEDFLMDSSDQAKEIFNTLVSQKVIDSAGRLSTSFDPNKPDVTLPELDTQQRAFVIGKLKQAAVGPYSFINMDKTKVNDQFRQDIKLKAYDGNYYTLHDIMNSIGKGSSPREKMKNIKLAYDYLLNMHNSMTDLTLDSNNNRGELVYSSGSGPVQVSVGKDGKWQEWAIETKKNKDGSTSIESGWKEKSGEVTLTFDSKESAQTFKEDTRELLAHLESIVSTMGREIDDQPIYVLTDNSSSLNTEEAILPDDPNYRMVLDRLPDRALMDNPMFKSVQSNFSQLTVDSYFAIAFNKSVTNDMQVAQWETEKDDYKKKKEAYEQEELARVKAAYRDVEKRKKEEAEVQKAQKKFADERRSTDRRNEKEAMSKDKKESKANKPSKKKTQRPESKK